MQRILRFATWTAVACVSMGVFGCITPITPATVNINSHLSSTNIKIERSDGIVVAQGQPPLSIDLKEGPVNIYSYPDSANVAIKRSDGIVEQDQTPVTIELEKNKIYTITISLEGYDPQIVWISTLME